MKNQKSFYKKIAFILLAVFCFNTFSFAFTTTAYAQALGEGPQQPTFVENVETGLTGLFGKMSTCSIGGGSQSELFDSILGPLATASRTASILGKLTDSKALKELGYTLDGAGNIVNNAGSIIGDIGSIAKGDLSGILNAGGGISELGSLLNRAGLVDVSGMMSKYGGQLSGLLNQGLSAVGGFVDSAIGSVFGSSATSIAGSFGNVVGGMSSTASGAGAAGSIGGAVLSVPVNDLVSQGLIAADTAALKAAQQAINERQDALNEIEASLQFKEYVLDCTTWNASHRISERVVADTLDFITKGNSGISWITGQDENPYYLSNPIEFYNNLGNRVADDYYNELEEELPDSAYKASLLALLAEDQKTSTVSERLTPTVESGYYNKFMEGDFIGGGGWKTYAEFVSNPEANDPVARYFFAKEARESRIETIADYYATQLDQGQGILGDTDEEGNIITPPTIVREGATEAVSTGMRSLENAQNFWQLVGNMGTLVTDIFRGFDSISSDGKTLTHQPKGLTNVSSPRIITPLTAGYANPFTPDPLSIPERVETKLTTIQTSLASAKTLSPVYVDSFTNLEGKIATLSEKNTASPLLVTRADVLPVQTDTNALIAQLQQFISESWYQRVIADLNAVAQNITDILALLNV